MENVHWPKRSLSQRNLVKVGILISQRLDINKYFFKNSIVGSFFISTIGIENDEYSDSNIFKNNLVWTVSNERILTGESRYISIIPGYMKFVNETFNGVFINRRESLWIDLKNELR